MTAFKKFCTVVYLVATALVLGCLLGLLYGPFMGRFQVLIASRGGRVFLVACCAVIAVGAAASACSVFLRRREPDCIHPAGHADIEVTCSALESAARAAASAEDVMVERVRVRAESRDDSAASVYIEAIAFVNEGLDELARRVQQRVRAACEQMLGVGDVSVRVRFLPSKTTEIEGGAR